MSAGDSFVSPGRPADCRRGGSGCRRFCGSAGDVAIDASTSPWDLLVIYLPLSPLWITSLSSRLCSDMLSCVSLFEFDIAGFDESSSLSIVKQICFLLFCKPNMYAFNCTFTKLGLIDLWDMCIGFTAT